MKIICTRENFKNAIFNSERVVSKQNTLPILNNLLFEVEDGGLLLSATNLEIGVRVKMGGKVIEKEGKITVPARLLSNFVNTLDLKEGEDNISIESTNQELKIKSGGAKLTIKGLPADDFPLIPKKTTDFLLKIPGKQLKNIITQVSSCVAMNETRQELTGINVILNERALFFAGTDSFRLAEKKIELTDKNVNKESYEKVIEKKNNIIIPANTLLELSRIISGKETEEVSIAIEESQIFFEINGVNLVSRLINGKYPEYKYIIPKEFKTRGVIEKESVQNAVRLASYFSLGKTSEMTLKIDAQKKKALIEARSVEIGENTSELDLDVQGEAQEVIFNSRYFLDGISTIGTSKAAILINSGTAPVALKEIDEKTGEVLESFTYIIMPIKA